MPGSFDLAAMIAAKAASRKTMTNEEPEDHRVLLRSATLAGGQRLDHYHFYYWVNYLLDLKLNEAIYKREEVFLKNLLKTQYLMNVVIHLLSQDELIWDRPLLHQFLPQQIL